MPVLHLSTGAPVTLSCSDLCLCVYFTYVTIGATLNIHLIFFILRINNLHIIKIL